MLNIYERPSQDNFYPKTFTIDYLRAYQRV
jgi:hypothetical protein